MENTNKYAEWAKSNYSLNFCDIERYLKDMDKKPLNFVNIENLPIGFKSMDDTVKFKCYNNEILDALIKNLQIQIEVINKKLSFINDYKKYLNEYDMKDCEQYENMLKSDKEYKIAKIKFLTELFKY